MSARIPARVSACLFLVTVLVVGCAATQDTGSPAASDAATAAPPDEPSATASESPTETASPSPSAAAEQTVEASQPVAFSITVPGDWEEDDTTSSSTIFDFRMGPDRWVVFTDLGPDTVEGWIERVTSGTRLAATDPAPIELDGAPGFAVDVELAEGEEEFVLFEEALWGAWVVDPDRPNRLWIVQSPSGPVVIVTDAPERAFDSWVEVVEQALATLEWGE